MKRVIIIYFLYWISSLAYINIYPLTFDQRIDGLGAIKNYVLTNSTTKSLKYQIDLEGTEDKFDMTNWSEIYPKAITLKPGEKKEIKMYIRSPKESEIGEYFTTLNIKELEVPDIKNRDKKIKVFTNLKVKLYGYVGELDGFISIKNLKVSKGENMKEFYINGKLKNESLRRINIDIVLREDTIFREKEEYLISKLRLKKGEEMELSNLDLLLYKIKMDNKIYKKLDTIYFFEKETGKLLLRQRI